MLMFFHGLHAPRKYHANVSPLHNSWFFIQQPMQCCFGTHCEFAVMVGGMWPMPTMPTRLLLLSSKYAPGHRNFFNLQSQ